MSLDHELITPAAVRDWTGAPTMWFAVGNWNRDERVTQAAVVAYQAAKWGVHVTWTEWQGMCHEYMVVTRGLPQASKACNLWAEACRQFFAPDKVEQRASNDCKAIDIEGGVQGPMPLRALPFESIRQLMRIRDKQRPVWKGCPLST